MSFAQTSEPRLQRVSYHSDATGLERDYFVYLPRDFASRDDWPVLLFLHGNGERGDGQTDLDYVLRHGPVYEAWIRKRDLPFVIISPQLPMYTRGEVDYIRNRTRDRIPQRPMGPVPPRAPKHVPDSLMNGQLAESSPYPAEGPVEGWNLLEDELLGMVDHVLETFHGDPARVYLSGLSYGGFGTWHLGAAHPERFAAMLPVVGFGHVDHAAALAESRMPIWQFAGGRDGAVPVRYFYDVLNELERLGHRDVRFTVEADMGHDTWTRVYASEDIYTWMLAHSRPQ